MTPGRFLIWTAGFFLVLAWVAGVRWSRGRGAAEQTFRRAYHAMTAALLGASGVLLWAIVTHDFRYEYVASYSSRDLAPLYLISAFWAGQQGTFLLWAVMAAVLGYLLFRRRAWEAPTVMAFYLPTIGFLVALLLDAGGDPFRLLGRVPADGNGLNPLLQDPWMASHPPAVFLGYAALTVPAVLALAALVKRREQAWLVPALRWSLAGFVLLGIGIVLGGFWAYKVLGWGGYWGWDPVENASLIPWIMVVVLIHGLVVQKATGSLRRTNLALALSAYVLVLYATFLTRSGVLASFSVHSFPRGTIFWDLVGILAVVMAVSVLAFWRRRGRPLGPPIPLHLGWPLVLNAAMVILALSAALVLLATSWPVLSMATGQAASIVTTFYNQVNLPLYLVVLALLGIAPFLSWGRVPQGWWKRLAGPLAAAGALSVLAVTSGAGLDRFLLFFFMAALALASAAVRFVQLVRVRFLTTGAALAHAGFAMLCMGVIASSAWDGTATVPLPLGQPVEAMGAKLVFRGHVPGTEARHTWRVSVQQEESEDTRLLTLYRMDSPDGEDSWMRKPAILRGLLRDLYLVPTGIQEAQSAGRILELARSTPVAYTDATLTFQRFETARFAAGRRVVVLAVVDVARGKATETVSLPLTASSAGMEGTPVVLRQTLPGTRLVLQSMAVEEGRIRVLAGEEGAMGQPQTMVLQARSKPLMSLLWAGTLFLCLGCTVAVLRRVRDHRAARLDTAGARTRSSSPDRRRRAA
ncbi:MAG: cytochrome c biogenesis protein CcsA [Acidobacteriota bacterium]